VTTAIVAAGRRLRVSSRTDRITLTYDVPMRVWWWALIVVVACKDAPRGPKLVTRIPHVAAADAVAAEPAERLPPALIVFVDANGALAVTAGPSTWSGLTAYAPPQKLKAISAEVLEDLVLEASAFRKRARDDLGSIDERTRDRQLAKGSGASDEDPPPPEEPTPLDEEDMPEAPNAKPAAPPPPPLPRTTRGRRSRELNAGFGYGRSGPGPAGNPGGSGSFGFARPIPKAERLSDVIGEPIPTVLSTHAVVAAEPAAKATALVDAVAASEGSILVEHAGAVRVLRVQFARDREREDLDYKRTDQAPFIEVRVTAQGIEVEGVPSPPTKLPFDLTALNKTVAVLAERQRFKGAAVDVLVGDDVRAQQLVDIVDALARGGVTSIGIGKRSSIDDAQTKHRGTWKRSFKVATGGIVFENQKSLDDDTRFGLEDEIRGAIKAAEPALRRCYDQALLTNPDLGGAGKVTFSTDPTGKVTKATHADLDPLVAECFVAALQKLTLAKRTSKGLIETTVQLTMRANP